MQFIYPSFLWAFALLLIPVIIHLFHFRRFKTVYFTNVRFLKEVKEETSSRSKLKNLLTLLMRLLAFSFLILAFAQPIKTSNKTLRKGRKAVSVFVDNSYSMQAKKDGVQLLSKGKSLARQVVGAFNEGDLFQILTHDFEGRHQIMVNKEDALGLIDEIKMTPKVHTLNQAVERQLNAFESNSNLHQSIYIVSDFQKSIVQGPLLNDSLVQLTLLPIQTEQLQNLSIDSAWFDAPVQLKGQTNTLYIKVQNRSDKDADKVRLSMIMNLQERPLNILSVPAHQSVIDTFNLAITQTGWQTAKLKITDFPIQFDDEYNISFNVPENVNILVLNNGINNSYLEALFKGISGFSYTNTKVGQVNYASFSGYDQIIIHGINTISSGLSNEIKKYISNGGNVLFFPGEKSDINNYNRFLSSMQAGRYSTIQRKSRKVGTINDEEFIFADVFSKKSRSLKLPETKSPYKLTASNQGFSENIMSYRDRTSFISKINYGSGRIYLCSAPIDLDYNDLVKHAEIFVPLMYKMALSKSNQSKLAYTIGLDEIISIKQNNNNTDDVFHLLGKGIDLIPSQITDRNITRINIGESIYKSGVYNAVIKDKIYGKFAYNYNRTESEVELISKEDLKKNYLVLDEIEQNNVATFISEKEGGKPLWKWVLIIALVCLALEEIILRFWKT